jgi:hypothetical protein
MGCAAFLKNISETDMIIAYFVPKYERYDHDKY